MHEEDEEGIDPSNPLHSCAGPTSRLFGYDWSAGLVSPFHAADSDEHFVTEEGVVDALLDHLQDVEQLVDLGSGDGRFCLKAARRGMRAIGVELDESLVEEARIAAEEEGLSCRFLCMDCTSLECISALPSPPTVLAYLLPSALATVSRRLVESHSHGRLLTLRWRCPSAAIDEAEVRAGELCLRQKLLPASTWPVYEYVWDERQSSEPRREETNRIVALRPHGNKPPSHSLTQAPTAAETDSGEEWAGLFGDIFAERPIVSPLDAAVHLTVGGVELHFTQQQHLFARREQSASVCERGIGADYERMTGALVWDASVVLARYLEEAQGAVNALLPADAKCVELGSGLGLTGLSAAALGLEMTLTDRGEVLPLLEASVVSNHMGGRVIISPLLWGDVDSARALLPNGRPFHGVLMADVIYEPELVQPLLDTVCALSGEASVIVIAYDTAHGRWDAYRTFNDLAKRRFRMIPLEHASKDTVKLVQLVHHVDLLSRSSPFDPEMSNQ
ncbi:MAG: hypothetical protein SGPRY_013440 [Prymnesium sp.]